VEGGSVVPMGCVFSTKCLGEFNLFLPVMFEGHVFSVTQMDRDLAPSAVRFYRGDVPW